MDEWSDQEREYLNYMTSLEGWSIVQRKLEQKIQYHKDRLMDCPTEEVVTHRTIVKELQGFFNQFKTE